MTQETKTNHDNKIKRQSKYIGQDDGTIRSYREEEVEEGPAYRSLKFKTLQERTRR